MALTRFADLWDLATAWRGRGCRRNAGRAPAPACDSADESLPRWTVGLEKLHLGRQKSAPAATFANRGAGSYGIVANFTIGGLVWRLRIRHRSRLTGTRIWSRTTPWDWPCYS